MLAASRAASQQLGSLIVKNIPSGSSSLEVWNSVCLPRGQEDAALLLLPAGYELLNPDHLSRKMVELLQVILTVAEAGHPAAAKIGRPAAEKMSPEVTSCNVPFPTADRLPVFSLEWPIEKPIVHHKRYLSQKSP